mgnify:CR=1 FL=1
MQRNVFIGDAALAIDPATAVSIGLLAKDVYVRDPSAIPSTAIVPVTPLSTAVR